MWYKELVPDFLRVNGVSAECESCGWHTPEKQSATVSVTGESQDGWLVDNDAGLASALTSHTQATGEWDSQKHNSFTLYQSGRPTGHASYVRGSVSGIIRGVRPPKP